MRIRIYRTNGEWEDIQIGFRYSDKFPHESPDTGPWVDAIILWGDNNLAVDRAPLLSPITAKTKIKMRRIALTGALKVSEFDEVEKMRIWSALRGVGMRME